MKNVLRWLLLVAIVSFIVYQVALIYKILA